ncbi:MAG: hypothetical protein RR346_08205 [Bacteroidales bacterium]
MNTRKTRLILFLFFWILRTPLLLLGAEPAPWSDVRSLGIARIVSPVHSFVNPASLSLLPERRLLFSYQNRFLVKQLSSLTACYQQPTKWVDFSALINYFGYDLYHEIRCGINVSKVLKPGLSLGVRIYYFRMDYIDNQDVVSVVSGDIGMQYQPVDNFRAGFLISNPFRVSYKQAGREYDLPVVMQIGAEFGLTQSCNILAGVEKDTRYPICFKIGIAYEVISQFELRAGLLTSPLMPTGGIGYRLGDFKTDIAVAFHTSLGTSPSFCFSYYF